MDPKTLLAADVIAAPAPALASAATPLPRLLLLSCMRLQPDICDKYKVSGYPTLYLGKASDVAAVTVDKLTKFDYGLFKRDGAGVVQFVSKQLSL
jgi:hypothetical protein